jgi:hypothetical protein
MTAGVTLRDKLIRARVAVARVAHAAHVTLVTCAVLLSSCAAPADGGRVLYLESEGYGCGAAPGLGCGLALAPVLAALDELPGVLASSASWDGRYVRLALRPDADEARVFAAAASLLEGTERRVAASQVPDAVGRAWYGSQETVALSRHEAGVLAADFARDIAVAVTLDATARERLQAELRVGFEQAFERAHAAGGGVGRLWEQFPQARRKFEQRLTFLSAEQRAGVSAFLDEAFEG